MVVLGVVVLAGASIIWSTLWLGIGPLPTSRRVRRAVLALVPGDVTGEVHELGAGWGGLALALARRCPRAHVIAWERSPVPFLVLLLRQKASRLRNLEVRFADFSTGGLEGACGVVCYLFPGAMTRLAERLRACGPETFVITHTFAVRGWVAAQTHVVDDLYRTPVYKYRRGDQPTGQTV